MLEKHSIGSFSFRHKPIRGLRITVEGIRSPHGTILIGLYDSLESFTRAIELSDKDGFLNDPNRFAAVALRANAARKSAVVLTNLDPGQYAIILFHDENGNGKLDKNALGVPTLPSISFPCFP